MTHKDENAPAAGQQLQALADQAVEWVNSPDGQTALKKALDQAKETTKQLREARAVTEKSLNEPMTL